MRDGYKVIDMDTHVNPTMEILEKYTEPSFRSRLDELRPYYRTRKDAQGIGRSVLSVGPITYNRYPGEARDIFERHRQIAADGVLAESIFQATLRCFTFDFSMGPDYYARLQDWMVATGQIERALDPANYWTNALVS